MAHAEITGIDADDARAMPGVVGVYSADDLDFPDHTGMMQLHPAVVAPSARRATGCASSAIRSRSSSPRPRRRRSTPPKP